MGGPMVMVLGAGAAGLMAALHAARAGADTVLVERTADGGRKILISGGGRCNVLPGRAHPERYVTASSPNTLKRILRSWPLEEQRSFFREELAIPTVLEEDTGKLFPASNRARDVRDALVRAVREAGGRIWFGSTVVGLEPAPAGAPAMEGASAAGDTTRLVRLDSGGGAPEVHAVAAVVVATGGLSVPQTGSSGMGLRLLEALGHTIHDLYPALTPLTGSPHTPCGAGWHLAGGDAVRSRIPPSLLHHGRLSLHPPRLVGPRRPGCQPPGHTFRT